MDLAEGHLAGLNFLEGHKGWYAINLGTGQSTTVLELLQSFEKINKIKIPYELVARRKGDVSACFAKPNYANKILHWKANRSIDLMCESSWKWESLRSI
jgi:UDP-glucose 4-epimerase